MRLATLIGCVVVLAVGCAKHEPTASTDAAIDAVVDSATSCNCNPSTQYCYRILAGVAPTVGCNDLPITCRPSPDCACVVANVQFDCALATSCEQTSSGITVSCNLP